MTTNRDIIRHAALLIAAIPAGGTLSAADAEDCLHALNNVLSRFDASGSHIGWSEQTLDDECLLERKHHASLEALLAVEIAPLFAIPVNPDVSARAFTGYQLIAADYLVIDPPASEGLARMPSQRRYI